ncbi:tyrosine-type recombinase/integrase [Raoultella ornithinolytica]|uniref:tyrosine-type recombinase/integrase n=1 Tax=Raoultella ornithinolytica TaxID=54291 RepID=UPI00301C1578
MKLNARQIETAKPKEKAYKLADGGGLYLEVTPRGSKYWRMKYRRPNDKKEDRLAFGVWPTVTLSDARAKRDEAKRFLSAGLDPKEQQKGAQAEADGTFTFETITRKWHAGMLKRWTETHANAVLRSLEQYIFPHIGNGDIRKLTTRQLLAAVHEVDATAKHDVAKRLRQRITAVMRYAVQNGLIDSNPALDMAGALTTAKVKHRPALPPARIPELLARIATYRGRALTRLAVEMTLLTFVRSSELRFARWEEFDLSRAVWNIPAQREAVEGVRYSWRGMKMKEPHIVPLSRQMLSILGQIQQLCGDSGRLFPGDHDPRKVMSENTVNKALRQMGYDTQTEVCGHGFRAMACGALVESGRWSYDAVERQMSHAERNDVRAAYTHTSEYLGERRLMMQWWADYLDANREAFVTPYDFSLN